MSYDIYIGNAELESEWPGEDGPVAEWTVKGHAEPDAPTFPGDFMTLNGNSRHPGYSQWADFCRQVGLYDLFFAEWEGLMCEHPGIAVLKPEHLAVVKAARELWSAQRPSAIAGWDFDPIFGGKNSVDDGVRGRDGNLARLLWLEWWMDWTLRTCERPALHNR